MRGTAPATLNTNVVTAVGTFSPLPTIETIFLVVGVLLLLQVIRSSNRCFAMSEDRSLCVSLLIEKALPVNGSISD